MIFCSSREKNIMLSLPLITKYQEIMMNGKKQDHSHAQLKASNGQRQFGI